MSSEHAVSKQTETRKRTGGRPPKWTPEQRAEAVRIAQAEGVAAAAEQTGMSRASVTRAVKAAGVDLEAPARQRTHVARAAKAAVVAEARRDVVEALAQQLDEAAAGLLSRLELHNRLTAAVAAADPDAIVDEPTITGVRAAAADPALRDLLRRAELVEGSLKTAELVRAQTALIGDRRLTLDTAPEGPADGRRLFVLWPSMPRPPHPPGLMPAGDVVTVFRGSRIVDQHGRPVLDEEGRQMHGDDLPDIDDDGHEIVDADVTEGEL